MAIDVESERGREAACETLFHMARQLLSVADELTRGRIEGAVTDLSSIVTDFLSYEFTETELMGVTAKLYAFLVEAGVIG